MPKVLLGKNIIDRPVYWEIEKEKNPHLLVLGTSGCGKTETLKAIIQDLNKANCPSMISDFHNEFSGVGKNVLNMRQVGMNPLEFSENEMPETIVYEVAGIMKKIFGLGEIQESILRQAIKNSYLNLGIDMRSTGPSDICPTFADVKQEISKLESNSNKRNIESLMSRIEPLFELDVFHSKTTVSFAELLNGTTVVELKPFPTEMIKSAVAEFFLAKLSYYVYSLDKTKQMKLYCVVDEAHRLMYEGSPLDRFLRESRKYGVGVILASQRPTDFNETVLANAGVLLSFQCTLEKDAAFVGRQLGVDSNKIRNLVEPGTGYVKFSRGEKAERVKITRLEERMTDEEKKEMKAMIKKCEKKPEKKKDPEAAPPPLTDEEPKNETDDKDITEEGEKNEMDEASEDEKDESLEEDKKKEKKSDERKEPVYDSQDALEKVKVKAEKDELEDERQELLERERLRALHEETKEKEESDATESDEDSSKDEDGNTDAGKDKYSKKDSAETSNMGSLSKLFFYHDEKFGSNVIFRTVMISLFFVIGFWLLVKLNQKAFVFFAIGLLWTPFFAELLNVGESRKVFTMVRVIITTVLLYLFLAY